MDGFWHLTTKVVSQEMIVLNDHVFMVALVLVQVPITIIIAYVPKDIGVKVVR